LQLKIPADGKFIAKRQTACFSQLHNISLSVCHFRKLLSAATQLVLVSLSL